MKSSNEDWFKHLQQMGEPVWVDPEQERKDNKNAKIVGWGLTLGTALLLLFRNETGFILFFASFGGSFLFLED